MLDTMRELERQGYEVTYLDVQENGLVDLDVLKAAIREDTILVSVMWVNNEIGVVQDIPPSAKSAANAKSFSTLTQHKHAAKCLLTLKPPKLICCLCPAKAYGPKGIGAPGVRRKPRVRLEAQMHGGGHERGFRSGTLPTHQIVGMAKPFRIAKEELEQDMAHYRKLRDIFLKGMRHRRSPYQRRPRTPRPKQPERQL